MDATEVLSDAIGRIRDRVHETAADMDAVRLAARVGPQANSIGWLLWHLTRVQDMHVSEFLDAPQMYVEDDWAGRLGLPADPRDSGYGHTSDQVGLVRIDDPAQLLAYHDAVARRSLTLLATLDDGDLDRIVDESWYPPVTAGVRWVSIVEDSMEHVGQAAYARGIIG